jgi:hypothetical protein
MGNLSDMLLKAAEVMHWLGKYQEANALILLSRLCVARRLGTLQALQTYVEEEEKP